VKKLQKIIITLVLLLYIQACSYAPTQHPILMNLERLDSLKTISNQQMETLVREYLRDTLRNAQIKIDLTKEMFWVDTLLVLEPLRSLKYIVSKDTTNYIVEEEGEYLRSLSLSSPKIQVYEPIYTKKALTIHTFRPALDSTRLALWIGFDGEYCLFMHNGEYWDFYTRTNHSRFSIFAPTNGYIYETIVEIVSDERLPKNITIKYTFSPDFRSLELLESIYKSQ
jgi:hypothetical protein